MKVIDTKKTEDGGMLITMDMSFETMKAFAAIGVKMMLVAAAMEEIAESEEAEGIARTALDDRT